MLKTHTAVWASIAVLALFFIGHYVFGRDNAKIVVDSLVIGSAVTIVLTWLRATLRSFKDGVRDGGSNILVSVWLLWLVLLGLFAWFVFFSAQTPEYRQILRETPISGLFSTLIFLSGSYAILVPIREVEQMPTPSLRRWMLGVAVGMFVAGSLMTLALLKIVEFS